jgi:hypothetical protein
MVATESPVVRGTSRSRSAAGTASESTDRHLVCLQLSWGTRDGRCACAAHGRISTASSALPQQRRQTMLLVAPQA